MSKSLTYDKFKELAIASGSKYTEFKFSNKHGERFIVIKVETLFSAIHITGDEYDWKITPLFSKEFDIYSKNELARLGDALKYLADL